MDWNLKGGVIIIGSLLWQDYLKEPSDNIRKRWREAHLDLKNALYVKVPIRYGRLSGKDKKIPTMVFSNEMESRKGFGYVIPFKKNINNKDELLCETISLSTAEGMNGNLVQNWGVLAYLFNKKIIKDNFQEEIRSFFLTRKNSSYNIEDYKVSKEEKSCISDSLELDIEWIEPVLPSDSKKLDKFHFLLATSTKPDLKKPPIEKIAELITLDSERRYFLNNLINGIITSEDYEIARLLK